jgi:hypothetical protein
MKKEWNHVKYILEEMRPMFNWKLEMIEAVKQHSNFMLEQSRTMEGPIKAVVQSAALSSMRDIELEMAWRN